MNLFRLIFLLLLAASSARAQQDLQAGVAQAFTDFHQGRVQASITQFRSLLGKPHTPDETFFLQRALLDICTLAGEWECTREMMDAAAPALAIPHNRALFLPELVQRELQAALWYDNGSLIADMVAKGVPFSTGTVGSHPVAIAGLQLALHDWYWRKKDIPAARQSLASAFLATLNANDSETYNIAQLILSTIEARLRENDILGAAQLLSSTTEYLIRNLMPSKPHYARLQAAFAAMSTYAENYDIITKLMQDAQGTIREVELNPSLKDSRLATLNNMATVALVLAGKLSEADAEHARHPLAGTKEAVLARGDLRSYPEFFYAVTDVFRTAAAKKVETRWKRLLDQDPKVQLDDDERRKMNAYRTFALGLIAADGTEEKLRLLMQAAAQQIAIFEETIPDSVEVIRLPDIVDKAIIRLGILAAAHSKPRDDDLVLRGAEILRRSLRTSLEDAVVLISAQPTPQARREVHSYLHLLDRKRAWETKKITDKVTARAAAKPAQDISDYSELVSQLAVARMAFARDQRSGDTAKHPLPILKEVQQTLGPNEAFLIHFDDVDGIGKLCVRNDATFFATTPLPKRLSDMTKSFRSAAATFPRTEAEASAFPFHAARELHALLFGGLEPCLTPGTHVLIAEDQALAGLPFTALVPTEPPRKAQGYDLRQAKWLGQQLSFSVVMSARHYLAVSHANISASTPRSYLGIGDPRVPPVPGQPVMDTGDLPDASEELTAAAALFKAPGQDLLIAGHATEEAFRLRPIGDYDVLHFATHTVPVHRTGADDEPALMLTSTSSTDPYDDGVLSASEISRLTLNARLAVLSACATATYKINALASGVQDFQAAFGIAGVPTLLMTLWPVESAATGDIIKDFFDRWRGKGGIGASEALFEATSQYLRSADTLHTHPAFWASFIVAGEGSLAERPSKPHPPAPVVDILGDYPGYGDVLQVSPLEDDLLLSLITGFDGAKLQTVLTRRKRDGKTIWKMLPEGTGIVRAIIGAGAIYVTAYTLEAKPTPSIRRIDTNGKLIWERAFPSMPGYVFGDLALTPDGIAVLATPTLADGEANAIVLMLLDTSGRTRQMATIAQDNRPLLGREAALIRTGDRLVAAVNSKPGPRIAFDKSSLTGYPTPCYPPNTSKLFAFDARTLKPIGEDAVPGLQVYALAAAGDELLLGGDIAQDCSMFGTAAIFSKRGAQTRMIWKSDDPFKTKVQSIGATGGEVKALIAHERALGNPSRSLTRINDYSSKRGAQDQDVIRESSLVTLKNDGRFVSESFVSSGLDALLGRSALTSSGAVVAVGEIGGNPAVVTFGVPRIGRRQSARSPEAASFWDW